MELLDAIRYCYTVEQIVKIISPGMSATAEAGGDIEIGENALSELIRKTPMKIKNLEDLLKRKGEMPPEKEREELAKNIAKLAMPLGYMASIVVPKNVLYEKENLTIAEKEQIKISSYNVNKLNGNGNTSRLSPEMEELFLSTIPVFTETLERIKVLMSEKEKVQVFILDYFIDTLRRHQMGLISQKMDLVDPIATNIGEANFTAPAVIDREKTPIVEGKTKSFTIDEIYEKRDIFPLHRVKEAQVRLGKIWNEYMLDLQENNGLIPDRKRQDY